MFYFEIYKQGKLIKRGDRCLNNIEWTSELMSVPETELVLPASYAFYYDGREDVLIHINGFIFWGHVKQNIEIDKVNETITVPIDHIVCEWEYRQISVNHAISSEDGGSAINVVYKGAEINRNESGQEAITANNFAITTKKVKSVADSEFIRRAVAQAWNLSNGDPIPIATVDRSKVKAKEGTYKVTFSTKKGTSVTVECDVSPVVVLGGERYKTNKTAKEKISARRFSIDINDVGELTNSTIIKVSKAKAWVLYHPKQSVEFKVIENNIVAALGTYTVKFGTANNTVLTIDVTVEEMAGSSNDLEPSIVDNLEDIYNNNYFAYPGWDIQYEDGVGDTLIDYIYSRQNKLEALTKTMELTPDLFWRVGFTADKVIEIGKFGKKKPYVISTKPSGKTNIRMLTEPTVIKDYENVINVATVYADKSDGGMSSVVLRDIYNDKKEQNKNFPVVILRANVNNERDYTKYISQFPELAPNNEWEYAVLDTESIALESGILIEGTFSFNDLGSFNTESKRITNAKRLQAQRTVYRAAIRKLKEARRNLKFELETEALPRDVNIGDKIRVLYDNLIYEFGACSNYAKKILHMDDWYYIESLTRRFDQEGIETDAITLAKYLKIERETSVE